ncbi:MAG: mechanosensitive ion channel protein MscS [Alphaproteobacteria bacterium RIFCSPHIGHO2_12_FULL_63_12]|nr:MAG: mechanosensitive ion channel protein MscS [Alphaproteobacteria bacterium RIFCSPHIGHO2_12_FULL_63_12]
MLEEAPPGDDSAIGDLIGARGADDRLQNLLHWLKTQLSSVDVSIQIGVIAAALIPAALFGPQLRKLIMAQVAPRAPFGVLRRAANAFAHIATPIALYLTWQGAALALAAAGRKSEIVAAAISLLAAWIVIRLITLVIRSPFWSRAAFYVVWPIAALDAAGLLDEAVRYLNSISIPVGVGEGGAASTFSALDLVRVIFIFAALFWISSLVSRFLKSQISAVDELTPSLQALLIKILDVILPAAAFLLALQIVGFNFATLAIFGGAVGLGIGLGLQRTISNFFAGFTLIADKSIKPGDVVEVGSTFGWVAEMNARYVTVKTRDGKSHLIPNDKFIEEGVINWSHSDRTVRLHAQFGVAYGVRDLRAVKKAAEETAVSVDRVLKAPAPMCNLVEFGDSSVNFDLRFWINDPANGVANVTSQVMLALWDRLHEMGVEFPFPQRDITIKSWPANPPMAAGGAPGG